MTYFLWLVAVLSLWAFLSDLRAAFDAIASNRWPEVAATVTASGWKSVGKGGFVPVVRYRYTVEGREFSADRIAFWGVGKRFGESAAQEWSNRWVANQPTRVRYDPKRAGTACLVPGLNWRLGTSLLLSSFGVAVTLSTAILMTLE